MTSVKMKAWSYDMPSYLKNELIAGEKTVVSIVGGKRTFLKYVDPMLWLSGALYLLLFETDKQVQHV